MSTVAEIKAAVKQLPGRQKRILAHWLQAQVGDQLTDDEMMAVAAEGTRELDRRENAQAIYTVPAVKLLRRKAELLPAQLALVEEKVKFWLGLK